MFFTLLPNIAVFVLLIDLFQWFIFFVLQGSILLFVFFKFIKIVFLKLCLLVFLLNFFFQRIVRRCMFLIFAINVLIYIYCFLKFMNYRIFYLNDSKEIAKIDTVVSDLDSCMFIKVFLLNIRSNCMSLPGYPFVQNVLIYQDDYCCFDSRIRFFPGRNVLSTRPHTVNTFKKICASHLFRFQPLDQATGK